VIPRPWTGPQRAHFPDFVCANDNAAVVQQCELRDRQCPLEPEGIIQTGAYRADEQLLRPGASDAKAADQNIVAGTHIRPRRDIDEVAGIGRGGDGERP